MNKIRRILAPTDFSEHSHEAIDRAAELAAASGAEILLMTVVQETDFPTSQVLNQRGFPNLHDEVMKSCKLRLADLRARIDAKIPVRLITREGVPAAAIADVASEEHVDMIVISTHGHTGLKRLFLGSTTERVVRIAPCSVLVVKPEEGAA